MLIFYFFLGNQQRVWHSAKISAKAVTASIHFLSKENDPTITTYRSDVKQAERQAKSYMDMKLSFGPKSWQSNIEIFLTMDKHAFLHNHTR